MAEDQRPGAAYWIDHFVVPTNDVLRWKRFAHSVLGAEEVTTDEVGGGRLSFVVIGRHHNGVAYRPDPLPPQPALGAALPRYGFYVRSEDLDAHRRRLEEFGVEATDPISTSEGGEDGTAICFRDPDGNECEFWAPRHLPPGAMDDGTPLGVGRISHAVFASRDLARCVSFHSRYLAIDPIVSADIPPNGAALRLAGGGRVLFQETAPGATTRGGDQGGPHAAFTVRDEEWDLVHERLWAGLPEAPVDAGSPGQAPVRPPWTRQRGSMLQRGLVLPRGYGFMDWDYNPFHFVRGAFPPGNNASYEVLPSLAE